MNEFISDIKDRIGLYYDQLVEIFPSMMIGLVLLIIFYFLARMLCTTTKRRLELRTQDKLLSRFIGRMVKIMVIMIGVLLALQTIGLGGLVAGIYGTAGVGAFVIGFAFKDIGENFLAGFIMAFDRPFRVGDTVELDGNKGKVVALNLRDTHIKSFDGKDIFIPNGNIIKSPLHNYTIDGFYRYEIVIGLDYDSDLRKAIGIVMEELSKVKGIIQDEKKPNAFISSLTASTINLSIQYWIDTFDKTLNTSKIKTDLISVLLKRLDLEGFNMPGDIIELKNYKGEEFKNGVLESGVTKTA